MRALEFVDLSCPYCGEPINLAVDPSAGEQQYIEDCQVCCRPMRVSVTVGDFDLRPINVVLHAEND